MSSNDVTDSAYVCVNGDAVVSRRRKHVKTLDICPRISSANSWL